MTETYAVELQDVVKQFGDVVAVNHVSLQIRDGEFFSMLGPSGCGKTTTLRMIAGFEMPTAGAVYIHGERQGYRPPNKRPVNTVFQNYALFPHMTVAENIAFGMEMQKAPKDEIKRRVSEALDMVRLSNMAKRKPKQLSGGQRQRIALARALVNRPKVLLLDEPLGALDLKLRKAMQLELKALQEEVGITFIYVTHDQEEALTMSDRIAVMSNGVVHQVGDPETIYEHPADRFVADFIGETNFIPVKVLSLSPEIVVELGTGEKATAGWAEEGLEVGDQAVLSIRPEKMDMLEPKEVSGTPSQNVTHVKGKVTHLVYVGTDTRHTVTLGDSTEIVARLQNIYIGEEPWELGEDAIVTWNAAHARILKE
jgi:spermidine/putrescine transport system ATP-binding protein